MRNSIGGIHNRGAEIKRIIIQRSRKRKEIFCLSCEKLKQKGLFFFVGTTTGTQEDLSTKVSAGANYIGSMFSSAWTKTAKTANDATTSSSTFFTSAFNKVGVGANGTPMTSAGTYQDQSSLIRGLFSSVKWSFCNDIRYLMVDFLRFLSYPFRG